MPEGVNITTEEGLKAGMSLMQPEHFIAPFLAHAIGTLVANFEAAIKLNPTSGGIYSDLGNCYRGGFKCYDKAELYYTKAIENGFSKGFVYYNRAICKFELNKLEEMRMDLETSKELGWDSDYYKLSEK